MTAVLLAPLVLGGAGLLMGLGLAVASRRLAVPVDPRVEAVAGVLPGANCAACGLTGCGAFARAVVEGRAKIAGCTAGGPDVAAAIARIMDLPPPEVAAVVAVIHCRGDFSEKRIKGEYRGIRTCAAANLVAAGPIQCAYGCLGMGDCVRACPFAAIVPRADRSPEVLRDKCTGCGLCVEACPKGIISLDPKNAPIFIRCSNRDKGKIARQVCDFGCLGCGICGRKLPGGILAIIDNVARIDYAALAGADPNAITDEILNSCPTKCLIRGSKMRSDG